MSNEPEKLSELLPVRITPRMAAQLDEAVRITGLHRVEIARDALGLHLERLLCPEADPKLEVILQRCRDLSIDVRTVLMTALIEEELSPTPAAVTA